MASLVATRSLCLRVTCYGLRDNLAAGLVLVVVCRVHSLVQDTKDSDLTGRKAINDQVRAGRKGPIGLFQVRARHAYFRVLGNALDGRVQRVSVDFDLFCTPLPASVADDADKVLSSSGRQDNFPGLSRQGITSGSIDA